MENFEALNAINKGEKGLLSNNYVLEVATFSYKYDQKNF
jgi:hypothetical protein